MAVTLTQATEIVHQQCVEFELLYKVQFFDEFLSCVIDQDGASELSEDQLLKILSSPELLMLPAKQLVRVFENIRDLDIGMIFVIAACAFRMDDLLIAATIRVPDCLRELINYCNMAVNKGVIPLDDWDWKKVEGKALKYCGFDDDDEFENIKGLKATRFFEKLLLLFMV